MARLGVPLPHSLPLPCLGACGFWLNTQLSSLTVEGRVIFKGEGRGPGLPGHLFILQAAPCTECCDGMEQGRGHQRPGVIAGCPVEARARPGGRLLPPGTPGPLPSGQLAPWAGAGGEVPSEAPVASREGGTEGARAGGRGRQSRSSEAATAAHPSSVRHSAAAPGWGSPSGRREHRDGSAGPRGPAASSPSGLLGLAARGSLRHPGED